MSNFEEEERFVLLKSTFPLLSERPPEIVSVLNSKLLTLDLRVLQHRILEL